MQALPPHYVKHLIRKFKASSTFRKKGPGRTSNLKDALFEMSQEMREIALAKGWDRGLLVRTNGGFLTVGR